MSTKSGERLSPLCIRQQSIQVRKALGPWKWFFPGSMHSDRRPFHLKTHRSNYYHVVYNAQPFCMLGFPESQHTRMDNQWCCQWDC
jgi:hypothetical protein